MPINIVRYREGDGARFGVVRGSRVTPFAGAWETTRDFMLEGAARARETASTADGTLALDDLDVLCPITTGQQFVCQAINYHSHMKESGIDPRSSPFNIFFRKASSCLVPATADIVAPGHVKFLDYEVELGLVFSRDVSGPVDVTDSNLHEYVGGLVIVNDISARDVQIPEMQFYKGKSYRSFGPTGPYLVLVDQGDLARFDALRLTLSVNGEVRQDSFASDMVHRPPATLTELSQLQDWRAGDLLATGTPGGCAFQAPAAPLRMLGQVLSPLRRQALLRRAAANNPKRLRPGDRIEASIRTDDAAIDLGVQRSEVVRGA